MATTTVDLGSVIGPQGEKGVNYKGSLNLQNTYVKDDLISYGGSTYIVIANSVKGVVPPNSSYYRVFAEKGDPGETGAQGETGPQGNPGQPGQDGSPGAPGPNQVTTDTATNITGLLKGNGSGVLAAVAGEDYAAKGITDSGGSSSTGYWVKFDDGTMICYKRTTIQANAQTAVGGLYRSDYISLGDFPVPFTTLVDIKPSIWNANASSVYMWPTSVLGPSNSSAGSIAVIAGSKYGGLAECMYTAVGRWK